jgi:SagB-type dehydrogenase family enzyme
MMSTKSALAICLTLSVLFLFSFGIYAEDLKPVQLPTPQMEGGRPLMEVLKDRHSTREFSGEKLSLQELSNLLWAAFGINRPDLGKRTAPSARGYYEIEVYVALADGLYLYDAKANRLEPISSKDLRGATGLQPFVKEAPLNLVYVANYSRMGSYSPQQKDFYSACNTGFIAENVYLYCASAGLATVVRGFVDKPALAKEMRLGPDQKITLAQSVGYPKK